MKRAQWITFIAALAIVFLLYFVGKTHKPQSETSKITKANEGFTTDSVFKIAKGELSSSHLATVEEIEKNKLKEPQELHLKRLAGFWKDSAQMGTPYAFYSGEIGKLENSEKNLTFAAHLFLNQMDSEKNLGLKNWQAIQAKALFEKALILNSNNDSTKIGLGSVLLLGGISNNPMIGLQMIQQVLQKDSLNLFAHMTLVKGAIFSNQRDKAIQRLQKVIRYYPENLEAMLWLADVYDGNNQKAEAKLWYSKSLKHIKNREIKGEIEKRIEWLSK